MICNSFQIHGSAPSHGLKRGRHLRCSKAHLRPRSQCGPELVGKSGREFSRKVISAAYPTAVIPSAPNGERFGHFFL